MSCDPKTRKELDFYFSSLVHFYNRHNMLPHEMVRMFLGAGKREDDHFLIQFWSEHLRKQADVISSLEQEVDSIRRELGRE